MTGWPPPALVLCAGLGTRLRPLTDYRAKPAMPVGDVTLVGRILGHLAAAGIGEAVLNLHHLPHTITRDVGDGSQFGLRIRYSWERPRVLGSAGGPRHALPLLEGEAILVVNGDTLCDIPLRTLWERHRASGARVTLGLMPHPVPGRYGGVTVAREAPDGPDGRDLPWEGAVTGFVPRTSPLPSVHYPGIQLIERDVLEALPDDTPAETVMQVYPRLIAAQPGSVRGVVFASRFDDVGTVDDYRRTCRALAADADGNVVDATAVIAPTASIRNCIVWPAAVVPEGCALTEVIVTGYTPLASGSTLSRVVI